MFPGAKGASSTCFKQIGPAELREFRNGWNNSAATTLRKHERVRSFLAFCISNGWLLKNPMEALKKPVVHRGEPADYFTREEFGKNPGGYLQIRIRRRKRLSFP